MAELSDAAVFGTQPEMSDADVFGSPSRAPGMLPSTAEAQSFVAGKDRALRDLIDRPASWLAHGSDYLGITSGAGPQVDAGNTADRLAYEQQTANQPAANLGRMGGQVALTLPIGGVIGKAASAIGDVAAAGASKIAPWVGDAASYVNDLLQGTLAGARPGMNVANLAQRGISTAAVGAEQGGTAAALTSGQSDQPIGTQVLHGAEAGAAVAPVANLAAEGVGAAKAALGGGVVNPEVQRLATLARDKYGINLTGDQISPSPAVQYIGSQLRQVPLSGMGPAQAALQSQFTKAVGKTIGEDVTQITPTVMDRAATRIGGQLDSVAAQTPVIPANNLVNGLAQVQHDASFLTPDQQSVIDKHINNVFDAIGSNGAITGDQYQSLTKFNSALGRATRSTDSDVRMAAIDIRHHLDDALQQSVPPGSPLLDQLQEARAQYKNLKTIEPLVVKGEPGEISPVALQGQVNRSFRGRGMRAAQPDLAELGDIGRQFNLRPDSGTAARGAIMVGLSAAGGAAAHMLSDPMNALYAAGAAAGTLGAGRIAGSMLRSPAYINRLLQTPAVASNPAAGYLTSQVAPVAALGYGALNRRGNQ